MVVLVKASKLIESFRNDSNVISLLDNAKRVRVPYKLLKAELKRFVVVTHKKLKTPEEFEKAIERMQQVQSFLDRVEEIRDDLLRAKRILLDLYQTGSIHLSEFHHIKKQVRTSSQRDEWVDEVLHPISSKRDKVLELLDLVEARMWNLKHTYSVLESQVNVGKMVWYMRNPLKNLDGRVR